MEMLGAWQITHPGPQTKIWMEKWSHGPPSSSRKKLSGAVLDAEVLKAENRVREKIVGKVGTGTCDGWKNKAKKSVMSTMFPDSLTGEEGSVNPNVKQPCQILCR